MFRKRLILMGCRPQDFEFFAFLAAVTILLGIFATSLYRDQPIFLVSPPVTRRINPYRIQYENPSACGYALNTGNWTTLPVALSGRCSSQNEYATCTSSVDRRWAWGPGARSCGSKYIDTDAAKLMLSKKWVACVGDSISRHLCAAVLRALGAPPQAFVFDRHADFERDLDSNIKLTFHWQPFPDNTTELLKEWGAPEAAAPDFVIVTSSLWHMLYVENAGDYGERLQGLAAAADQMKKSKNSPFLLASSGTEIYSNRLPTLFKRKHMTTGNVDEYNMVLDNSWLLAPKGPFGLLDMFTITEGCGEECSNDGIHSAPAVYDAALQVALNVYKKCKKDAGCYGTVEN